MPKMNPCLWFDGTAEDAANLYVGIFPNSRIDEVARTPGDYHAGTAGAVLAVRFTLDGAPFLALNGGPMYQFSPAISFQIECADQAEVDHYWDRLCADGGTPGRCGWLVDRYGVSWQVNPQQLGGYIGGPDSAGAARAQKAMMAMEKLVIEDLRRAYEGA
jgi:predicted 3-demethylubiquinone-9 3-methyltransferase (glyoxalase superfamily)